jgi:cytochrome c biogenesis protein CcmG/thiol:disulfide interchange protein DsbE
MISITAVVGRVTLFACMAGMLAGCAPPRRDHPAVGRALGRLPIVSLADPAIAPPELRGGVTLLNFWGTWCPPCRRELPGLVRLAGSLRDQPAFQLVAVSCGPDGDGDPGELGRETARFLDSQQLEIDAWAFADPLQAGLFASASGLDAFPTTYLIGPDGIVRRVWRGYRSSDEADIAAAVVALLKTVPAAAAP